MKKFSTKKFVELMKRFDIDRSLIVTDTLTSNLQLSCRNVPNVKFVKHDALNVHDLLKYKNLIITQRALQSVEGGLKI